MARRSPPPPPPPKRAKKPSPLDLVKLAPEPPKPPPTPAPAPLPSTTLDREGLPGRIAWARASAGLNHFQLRRLLRMVKDSSGGRRWPEPTPLPVEEWEAGTTTPPPDAVAAIARLTKVYRPWLERGEPNELTAEDEEKIDQVPSPAGRKKLAQLLSRLDGGYIPAGNAQKLSRREMKSLREDLASSADVSDVHEEHTTSETRLNQQIRVQGIAGVDE